jgi:hypothetical protein
MTVAVSMFESTENRIRKVLKNGTGYFRSRFINDENSGQPEGPTCYLIEQDPNTVIGAHFHQANQFQVIVAGGGKLGKRDVGPIVVHYTDAYTTYGPINAHDEGLHYFTLRDGFDPGARFMPEQRAELIRKRGRHIVSDVLAEDFAPETNEVEVITPQEDGLEARLIRIGGGETVTGLDPAGGGGQFWLVISGNVIHERRWIESYGCIHVAGDDRPLTLTGADGGAEVIMMQFPRPPH